MEKLAVFYTVLVLYGLNGGGTGIFVNRIKKKKKTVSNCTLAHPVNYVYQKMILNGTNFISNGQ